MAASRGQTVLRVSESDAIFREAIIQSGESLDQVSESSCPPGAGALRGGGPFTGVGPGPAEPWSLGPEATFSG